MVRAGSFRNWLFVLALLVAVAPQTFAITSAATGNWSAAATWVGGVVPTATDPVVIANGHTVTVDTPAAVAASVTLSASITNTALTFAPTGQLNVSGTLLINDGGFVENLVNVGDGLLSCGDLDIRAGTNGGNSTLRIGSGTAQVNNVLLTNGTNPPRIEFTAPGKLAIKGNMASNGTHVPYAPAPGSTIEYNGSGAQTAGNYNNYNNLVVTNASALPVTAFGTINVSGQLRIQSGTLLIASTLGTGAASQLLMSAGTFLKIGDNSATFAVAMPPFPGGYSLANGSTIEYGAAFSQNITAGVPYQNLYLRNGGGLAVTRTPLADTTVAGDLTIDQQATGSITLNTNNVTVTVTGSVFGDGAVDMTAGGTLRIVNGTFSNTLAFSPGANGTVEYAGFGQSVRPATYANLVIDGGNVLLAGATNATNVTVNGTKFLTPAGNALIVAGNLTVDGTISGTTGSVQVTGTGGTITGSGEIYPPFTANTATVAGSLLFGGNFTLLSGTSIITNTGITDIDLTLDGPGGSQWINAPGSTLNIGGHAMTSGGTLNAAANANTVTYDGTGGQTLAAGSYHDLALTGSGVKTMPPGIDVANDLSITGAADAITLDDLVVVRNVLIAPTASLDGNGFFHQVGGNWTSNNKFLANGATVLFNGTSAAQSIGTTTFFDVQFDATAPKSLTGNVVATGTFTIATPASVAGGTGLTHSIGGDWLNAGTFTPETSTVQFNGGVAQTVQATPFYNVTVNGAGVVFTGNVSASNVFHLVAGNVDAGANTLTVGTLDLDAATTLGFSTGNVIVSGDLVTDGAISTAGGTVTVNGAAIQNWTGVSQSLFNLVINKSAASLNPAIDLTVTGTLTMTNGSIVLVSPATLYVSSGLLAHTAGHVNGRLKITYAGASQLFPLGTTFGDSFVTVTGAAGDTVDLEIIQAPHPANTGSNTEILQTYWRVHAATAVAPTITFNWPLAAVNGTEANYVLAFYDGAWSQPGGTVNSATHDATIAAVSAYVGDWTVGAPAAVGGATAFEITSDGSAVAGVAETFTITAKDSLNNTATGYTGSHTLVFSGANNAPDGTQPTASNDSATDIAFGSGTALTFTNGVATTSLKLYNVEVAAIDASETSGPASLAPANITVVAGAAAGVTISDVNGGNPLFANAPFSMTVASTDAYGNAANVPADANVTLALNCVSCTGTLSGPTSGTILNGTGSVTLTGLLYSAAEGGVVIAANTDAYGSADSPALTFAAQSAGFVVTTTADGGAGSLRDAITRSNNGECVAPCPVTFSIASGAQTIAPLSPLPVITNPISLDATSQPGYAGTPLIHLDGISAGVASHGLEIAGAGSTVRGFVIGRFAAHGIRISADNTTVQNSWIGLATDGLTPAPNGTGISILGNSNTIGNAAAALRNVISGNTANGITLTSSASSNSIVGNYIGTDTTGLVAVGNAIGIALYSDANSNTIGGAAAGAGNVIAASTTAGIQLKGSTLLLDSLKTSKGRPVTSNPVVLDGTAQLNVIAGNYIGVAADGLTPLPNTVGVEFNSRAKDNDLGIAGAGNVISGNGRAIVLNASTTTNNRIRANLVGVAANGTTPVPNTVSAIEITASTNNAIGGAAGEGNTIANNAGSAISAVGGTGNTFLGNSIYTNGGAGIDLNANGPDAQDDLNGDADAGANGTQNYGVISSATIAGSNLNVTVSYDSSATAAASILLETFEADASGEGKTLLSSTCMAGNVLSNATITMPAGPVVPGDPIVTTATSFLDGACSAANVGDGTSEFSPAMLAAACTPPPATITAATSACESSSGNSASVPASAGSSYVWTIVNGTIDGGQGTNAITFTAGATGTVTLGITVTSASSCVATDTHTLTINPLPDATITAPTSSCANVSGLAASVPAIAGATYSWSITNGTIDGGSGTDSITFTAGAAGTTTLAVTVTANGCSASDSHVVTIDPNPTATISASSTADPETSHNASVPAQAGATYAWSISNGTIDSGNGTPAISFTTGASGTTTLSVTVTLGSCSKSDTKNISINNVAPSEADLSISKTAASTVAANGTLVYTISVTNNGPSNATDVSIHDPLPAGTTLQSINDGTWTCTSQFSSVTCNGPIAAGSTRSVTITVAAPGEAGTIVNTATLASSIDTTPGNNTASATTVVTASDTCGSLGVPLLTAPTAGASVSSPVTIAWTAVPDAIGYRVWLEAAGGPAQLELGTTDGATELTANVPTGVVVVYVDALFANCPSTRSAPVSFTVMPPTACGHRTTATPTSPANGAALVSTAATFKWIPANDPDGYRVWIRADGGTPFVLGTTVDETTFDGFVPTGSIEWWIESLYDGCMSTESQHFFFNLPAAEVCTTDVPSPLSPANGGSTSHGEVLFTWSPVSGALAYELWLSVEHGTPTLMGTTSATMFQTIVPPGTLEWFVRAILDRCPARDSATATFVYDAPAECIDALRPIAISPISRAHVTSPVDFAWTEVANATKYELYVRRGDGDAELVATTAAPHAENVALSNGRLRWFVRAFAGGCAPLESAEEKLEVVATPAACSTIDIPQISAIGQVSSGVPFLIQWTPVPGATAYRLQLSDNASFDGAVTVDTTAPQHQLVRTNSGENAAPIYARVAAIDARCQPVPTMTAYGLTAAIYVLPVDGVEGSAPTTGDDVTHTIQLGPELAGQSFVATAKEPWLTITPSSGIVAAGGTTLVVTANVSSLPVGTTLGSVTVTLDSGATARGPQSEGTTFNFSTISVGKVTPITPTPKSTPPPDALIIPAVAHANGINSQFQSDVRLTNSSARSMQYQLTFTPSGESGIATGRQTLFSVDAGRTVALDDVLRSWFGTGDQSVTGSLEIRPMTQTSSSTSSAALTGLANLFTFASSRTFNTTSTGSFGQYIPAVPFANFIGRAAEGAGGQVLSLQQIAQSDRYRTNLGLLEGSGEPASLLVKVFGGDGQALGQFPVDLAGGQHLQLNSFLTSNGIASLDDGRVEISVTSPGGKVTAYASVLDNATNDPLLVTPVTLSETGNTKWVVPGVADLQNSAANWQTDMRLFNAGSSEVDVELAFFSQNGGAPQIRLATIDAGEVLQFDRTLSSLFGVSNDGGAVHIATKSAARLVATARTYNQTTGGTYGQFISAVTPNDAAALGTRPLQILQVEESSRFRSNIGLAEVSGSAAIVEIAVVPPDSKFTAVTQVTLQPNEFRQLTSMLRSMGLENTYNARVSVRVLQGAGRVTAYASVIDMATNDPTYVPAQ